MEKGMISTFVITDCMEEKKGSLNVTFAFAVRLYCQKYQLSLTLFREKTLNRIGTFSRMTSSRFVKKEKGVH